MSQWHSRLTLLNSLRIIHKEDDDEQWINIQDFVKLLQKHTHKDDKIKIRRDAIQREIEKHHHGIAMIDSACHLSVRSALRYIFHHCDQLVFCKRTLSQMMSVLLVNQDNFNFSSHKEVYSAIAQTKFHSPNMEKHLYDAIDLSEDDIPTLMKDYKDEFTKNFAPHGWKRICLKSISQKNMITLLYIHTLT